MKRFLAPAVLLAALIATPASAAHWVVDYSKSKLGFAVKWSGEPFVATFKSWKADIEFDPDDLAHSHAVVTIDLGSEVSDSPDNDDGVKGAQGFQVSQFPTAKFETTGFQHATGADYVADGKLTIKGISKPASLVFRLLLTSDKAHVTGRADVLRTVFGLGQGEWAGETPVAHHVMVIVDLQASKAR